MKHLRDLSIDYIKTHVELDLRTRYEDHNAVVLSIGAIIENCPEEDDCCQEMIGLLIECNGIRGQYIFGWNKEDEEFYVHPGIGDDGKHIDFSKWGAKHKKKNSK